MIHHSVLVDVSSKILNGKDRIMYKGTTVVSINPYALNTFISQVIFMLTTGQQYMHGKVTRLITLFRSSSANMPFNLLAS